MNDDDYEAEHIKKQQDPRHDQSAFKYDVVCPTTGGDYVTTITGPTYDSAVESYNTHSYTFSGGMKMRDENGMLRGVYISSHVFAILSAGM